MLAHVSGVESEQHWIAELVAWRGRSAMKRRSYDRNMLAKHNRPTSWQPPHQFRHPFGHTEPQCAEAATGQLFSRLPGARQDFRESQVCCQSQPLEHRARVGGPVRRRGHTTTEPFVCNACMFPAEPIRAFASRRRLIRHSIADRCRIGPDELITGDDSPRMRARPISIRCVAAMSLGLSVQRSLRCIGFFGHSPSR